MPTSQTPALLAEILDGSSPIPIEKLAYFRRRLRLHLHELVLEKFYQQETMTKADLARRIDRRPEVINRWLGAPGNWTLDTVSDLLIAMASEPEFAAISIVSKIKAENPKTDIEQLVLQGQRPLDRGQNIDPTTALDNLTKALAA
jgi:hypothetical protein